MAHKCPKCGSNNVSKFKQDVTEFFAADLMVCECKAVWEPFEADMLSNADEALSPFKGPCNNCAFRKDSPERSCPEKWDGIVGQLVYQEKPFYCHKGVPINLNKGENEVGFDYPEDPNSMRLCSGS